MKKCKEIEKWIVLFVNRTRKSRHISPLRKNNGLSRIARHHSRRMAGSGRIWHGDGVHIARKNLSSNSFWDFLKSFFNSGISGENVGLMCSGLVRGFKHKIRTQKDIALAQHKSWMRSSGHRKNILNPDFKSIGVGVKKRGNRYYSTQLFYG